MDVGKPCVAASMDPCNMQVRIWQMFRLVKKADMQVVEKDGFRQHIGWCRNYTCKQEDEDKESQVNEGPQEQEKEGSAPGDLPVLAFEERNADAPVIAEEMRARKACVLPCSMRTTPSLLERSIVNADVFLATSSADLTDEEKADLFTVRNEVHLHHGKREERKSSEELQISDDRKQAEMQLEVNEPQSCTHSVPISLEMAASVHQPPVVESGVCSALDLEATETPPALTLAKNLKLGGNITHGEKGSPQYPPVPGTEPSINGPLQESSGDEVLQQRIASITKFSRTILLHVKAEPVEEEPGEMGVSNSPHAQSAKFSRKLNVCSVKIEPTRSEGQTNMRWEPNRYPETHKEETTTSDSSVEDNSTCSEDEAIKTARTRRLRSAKKVKTKTKARIDKDGEVEDGLHPNKHPKLETAALEIKKLRNRNPGRRVQGGRLYDSVLGQTCHWCRQKTVELHVKCRDCTIMFCGPCLLNRNGEKIHEELCEGVHWVCPKCRGGCGPGCKNCCNCGPCRKADGKSPTGQRVFAARVAGFNNVHDFLVHLETGESPAVIADRKKGCEWTNDGRFKYEEAPEDFVTDAGEDTCLDGDKDVAPTSACRSTKLQRQILCRKYAKKVLLARKKMRGAIQAESPAVQGRVPGAIHCKEFSLPMMKDNGQVSYMCTRKRTKSRSNQAGRACKVAPVSNGHSVAQKTQLQEGAIATPVCKREFEEVNKEMVGCKVEVVGCEEYRLGKRLRAELKDPVNDSASGDDPVNHLHKKEVTEEHIGANASDGLFDSLSKRNNFNSSRLSTNGEGSPQVNDDYPVMDSKIDSREVLSNCMPSLTPKQNGWGPPSDIEGEEYCVKLRAALASKFDAMQLEELLASASCRKPVLRVRHMRGRTIDSVTENEGLSYLDHHPDLAAKLENATKPEEKLSLLRGLFFWLQHSCMVGAFKPWLPLPPPVLKEQNGDCFETNGPDCKVTAVVYSLDKTKPMRHSEYHKSSKASSQSVQRKGGVTTSVWQRPSDVEGTTKYRVVLCLPAPTHCQVAMKGSTMVKPSTENGSG